MKKVFILVVLSVLAAVITAQGNRKFNTLAEAQRALENRNNNRRNTPDVQKTTTNQEFETILDNGAVKRTQIRSSSNKAAGGNSESHEVHETITSENSTDIIIERRRKSFSRSASHEIQAVIVEETASDSDSKERGGRKGWRKGGRRGGCRRRRPRRRGCRRGFRRHRVGRVLRLVYYRIWIGDNVTKSFSLEVHTYAINFIGVMKLAMARFGGPWTFKYIGFPCGKRITQLGRFPNDPATNKVWVLYDLKRRPNQRRPPKDAFIVSRSPSHYKIKEFHTYLYWYRTFNNASIYPIYTEDSTAVLPTLVRPKWNGPSAPAPAPPAPAPPAPASPAPAPAPPAQPAPVPVRPGNKSSSSSSNENRGRGGRGRGPK